MQGEMFLPEVEVKKLDKKVKVQVQRTEKWSRNESKRNNTGSDIENSNLLQLGIFEFLDKTLSKFQKQVDFNIVRYRKNFSWDSQNREEWFLYTLDNEGKEKCIPVYTMKDLTIVRGLEVIELVPSTYNNQLCNAVYFKGKLVAYEPSTNVYVQAI
ncbi:hypothetical protein P4575_27785 [Priestia megaterium]|uniref:hypothetical protein n=1 Tax=Priestia megaterium TaxID=1404 RepID=UPI002E21A964|nr:hypothetical protein [Priestia megaterium]